MIRVRVKLEMHAYLAGTGFRPVCRVRRPDLRSHVLPGWKDARGHRGVRAACGAADQSNGPLRTHRQLADQHVYEQRGHRQPLSVSEEEELAAAGCLGACSLELKMFLSLFTVSQVGQSHVDATILIRDGGGGFGCAYN